VPVPEVIVVTFSSPTVVVDPCSPLNKKAV
jgi:hypothetical protein